MRNGIAAIAVACWVLAAPAAGTAEDVASLHAEFDPGMLDVGELRFLEVALAASGDFDATPDPDWNAESAAAFATYAARTFSDRPRNLHAAGLALRFLARIDAEGWALRHDPDLDISFALPEALMGASEPEEGGTRQWSADGTLTVLTHVFSDKGAANWHAAAETTNSDPAALVIRREPGILVTRGRLGDGRVYHTRSDRVGGVWATVYVASDPASLGHLDLIAASIAPGALPPWELPEDGRLAGLLDATVTLLNGVAGDLPVPAMAAGAPSAAPSATQGTGTGFFVADKVLVTADHVVGTCTRVALADGTELRRLGADEMLDVAVFATPEPASAWFALSPAPRARLGQRVHAAGFPYYSIVGTALHLTGGNVSALAGVNDDDRFFSFTAPVQPGNSGGPLIDSQGRVMGLVVSRLSEHYIVEETGSLPQNVNYALGSAELAEFLERIGAVSPEDGAGFEPFDMDAGMPEDFERAVVPVICL